MVISTIWMDMEVDNSAKNLESQKSKFVLFQSLEYWSLDFGLLYCGRAQIDLGKYFLFVFFF